MLTAVSIKLNIKLAQGFPEALRTEKSEPWAIDVLVHWKNVFSADTINKATGVRGGKLEIQAKASELRKKSDIWIWKIQAKHDKFKPEHSAKHTQSLSTFLSF